VDTSRISFGEMVAAASGLALFLFMFLPWYGVDVKGASLGIETPSATAWEAFSFIDVLLFLVCAVAIGAAVLRAMDAMPELPAPVGQIVAAAGALAVILILFRLIDTPGETGSFGGIDFDVTRKIGIFLGLIAAGGVAFGGYTQMNEPARGAAPRTPASGGAAPPPPPAPPPAGGPPTA
jgi:hypothetical protein